MTFAITVGGGGGRGGSRPPLGFFLKYFFWFKTIQNTSLTAKTCFALSLGLILIS